MSLDDGAETETVLPWWCAGLGLVEDAKTAAAEAPLKVPNMEGPSVIDKEDPRDEMVPNDPASGLLPDDELDALPKEDPPDAATESNALLVPEAKMVRMASRF